MERVFTFVDSLLTFYLKGQVVIRNNFIGLNLPSMFLAFFPLGTNKFNIPVNQISSVDTGVHFNFVRLIVGLILLSISTALHWFLMIVFMIVAINMILSSYFRVLSIQLTSGVIHSVGFFFFEQNKAEEIAEIITIMINEHIDERNVARNTDRVVDALKGQR